MATTTPSRPSSRKKRSLRRARAAGEPKVKAKPARVGNVPSRKPGAPARPPIQTEGRSSRLARISADNAKGPRVPTSDQLLEEVRDELARLARRWTALLPRLQGASVAIRQAPRRVRRKAKT